MLLVGHPNELQVGNQRLTTTLGPCLKAPISGISRRGSLWIPNELGWSIRIWKRSFWVCLLAKQNPGSYVLFRPLWISFTMHISNPTLLTPFASSKNPGFPFMTTCITFQTKLFEKAKMTSTYLNSTLCNTISPLSSFADLQMAIVLKVLNNFILILQSQHIKLVTRRDNPSSLSHKLSAAYILF